MVRIALPHDSRTSKPQTRSKALYRVQWSGSFCAFGHRARTAMETDSCRVLDALPALVWTTQPDGRLDFVSRRWCEYTGISAEDALGGGWQRAFHPEDLPRLLERWQAVL